MTRMPLLFIVAAAAALAGCNSNSHTIVAGPDTGDNEANTALANSAPVELPPSIAASKIYRCKDNSVVYIDWLSDNKSANVRTDRNGVATHVAAAEAGKAMSGDGFSLTGSATAGSVTLARPGHDSQSCKA